MGVYKKMVAGYWYL